MYASGREVHFLVATAYEDVAATSTKAVAEQVKEVDGGRKEEKGKSGVERRVGERKLLRGGG